MSPNRCEPEGPAFRLVLSVVVALALGVLPGACGGDDDAPADGSALDPDALLVLAASDLVPAFQELAPIFEERTGTPVDLVFGSTGNLAAQIRHGAPADLFFAADERFLDDLVERGRIDGDTRRVYAVGRLVVTVPTNRPLPHQLVELGDDGYTTVAIANPEHAPYGRAARQALESVGIWEMLPDRIVFGENIAHTLRFVETGNVDAAVVALSLVQDSDQKTRPHLLVDGALHEPLVQAAGVTTDAPRPEAARAFLDFVTAPEGQALLERYGFEPPPGPDPDTDGSFR